MNNIIQFNTIKYCVNCGKPATTMHHIVPKSLGGLDNNNLVPLCDECHGKIHNIQFKNGVLSHSELTKIGLEKARLNGKQIGGKKGVKLTTKKSIEAKEIIKQYSKDFYGTLSDIEVIKLAGISRTTYYKYKKELKNINEKI